jgi:hypothetical protein
MKLCFSNSKRQERVIAEPNNSKEVWEGINSFISEKNFKSLYTRYWQDSKSKVPVVVFDVGSHTEFFMLYGTQEELNDFILQTTKKQQ